MRKYLLSILVLTSCVSSTYWSVDSIETGNRSFDSSRLCYRSSSPLHLEFIRTSQEIFGFINLTQFHFSNSSEMKVQFTADQTSWEESFPVTAGTMRLKLSPIAVEKLFSSLQEGKKVAILVDGFEETLLPENFQKSYEKWMGSSSFLKALLKGPLE